MKKNMVKTLALAGMAVLTMGTLGGCGSNTTESTAAPTTAQSEAETTTAGTASAETTTAAPAASADLKGSISMVGSTSMEKFATALSEIFMEKYPNITSEVIAIKNNFFGEKITVSGLITGQDLIEQLSGRKLGDRLLIPCNMLRSGEDVFLDDITITELSEKLGKEIIVVDPGGADLVSAVLDPVEHKKQIRRQMYEQTSSCNSGKA